MNRIVLIGNGFDLAHGLKTRYEDFINWYWERRVDGFVGNITNISKDPLCTFEIIDPTECWNVFAFQLPRFFQRIPGNDVVQTITKDTERFKLHPEDVLKNPSSLYILDITHAEALAIQKTYGVLCVSGDSPDITLLIDINDIHITKEQEKLGRGWDTVLDSVEPLPSNALLLTDRYLFAFKRPNAGEYQGHIE